MNKRAVPSQKSLDAKDDRQILCCYINTTSRLQVIQIKTPHHQWQRVVFAGERLMFEAVAEAELEVYLSETASYLIPCQQLRVAAASPSLSSPSLSLVS